jgi:hypothetical protein
MTQYIVKTIDTVETDHFELFNGHHEEIGKAMHELGKIVNKSFG